MASKECEEIVVGDMFDNFEAVESRIAAYSTAKFTQLWMRDSRTIAAAAKRVPKRAASMKPELKYAQLKYCCIHGGKEFRKRGSSKRATT